MIHFFYIDLRQANVFKVRLIDLRWNSLRFVAIGRSQATSVGVCILEPGLSNFHFHPV